MGTSFLLVILLPNRLHKQLRQQGFYRCASHLCKSCNYTLQCKQFHNSDNSRTYNMNCDSSHVIYVILCDSCNKMYVGCTTRRLKVRALEHLNYITNMSNRNTSNSSKDFIDIHHSNTKSFNIFGIEKIKHMPRGGDFISKLMDRKAYGILMLNIWHQFKKRNYVS